MPGFVTSAGFKTQGSGRGNRFALNVLHKLFAGCVVIHKRAAVNVAIAGSMLQRNFPLPTGRMRGRAGKGCGRLRAGGLYGTGTVTE